MMQQVGSLKYFKGMVLCFIQLSFDIELNYPTHVTVSVNTLHLTRYDIYTGCMLIGNLVRLQRIKHFLGHKQILNTVHTEDRIVKEKYRGITDYYTK